MPGTAARTIACLAAVAWTTAGTCVGAKDFTVTGPSATRSEDGIFSDRERGRNVPYRLFRPAKLTGRHPVIIYSHGNGGSRLEAAYLAEHLASHGYVVVHIQHAGSDAVIWSGAQGTAEVIAKMKVAAADDSVHEARYRDVPFVLDELARVNARHPQLAGHLDLGAIGMSGHSWGALTTLVLVGARNGPDAPSYRDERIKAAVALSPSLPRVDDKDLATACAGIGVPMLHVTGTSDTSPVVAGLTYQKRLGAYRAITAPHQHLLVLAGADHMVFPGADGPLRVIRARDHALLSAVKATSLAFWDAYLRHDDVARHWLAVAYGASRPSAVFSMESK